MGFLDNLRKMLGGSSGKPGSDAALMDIRVRCLRCGEILSTRVNRNNELSEHDEGGFFAHKTLVGSGTSGNRCFNRIEVDLEFDSKRVLTERHIQGGTFVDDPIQETT